MLWRSGANINLKMIPLMWAPCPHYVKCVFSHIFPGLFRWKPYFSAVWEERLWGASVHRKSHSRLPPGWLPLSVLLLRLLQHEEAHRLQRLLHRSRWDSQVNQRRVSSCMSNRKVVNLRDLFPQINVHLCILSFWITNNNEQTVKRNIKHI